MILVGSQRGGARQLAAHLLNEQDNDHITVAELRGFIANDLDGALVETQAIAGGTRCKQYLFSLSLNPPKDARVEMEALMAAAERAEEALGLKDQPRAIVLHEKEGRRHAHVVWSRINADTMTAINLPHFKKRLNVLSREFYLENGWTLPEGYKTNGWKNPLNFSLAEWQQAKRIGLDPREIKQIFREAWERSDNLQSLRHALEQHGYFLARGDRRNFVAVDINGETFALARWIGLKTKDVNQRLGAPEALPTVSIMRTDIRNRLSGRLRGVIQEQRQQHQAAREDIKEQRQAILDAQRAERQRLTQLQAKRRDAETKVRAARFRKGFMGVWDLLTGKAREVRRQNEQEAMEGKRRDRAQFETLVDAQMRARAGIQARIRTLRDRQHAEHLLLVRRLAAAMQHIRDASRERGQPQRKRSHDPGLDL
jgi:hypothetical protein